jgi:hypothetical protein
MSRIISVTWLYMSNMYRASVPDVVYLFVVHLTTLPVSQTTQRRMVSGLVNKSEVITVVN